MEQSVESVVGERLVALYRRYVGEPDRLRDVYLGFGLFFGGIALGVLGLIVFLVGSLQPESNFAFWQFREVAISLVGVGVPAFFVSITILLPVGRKTEYAAAFGGVVTLVAIGIFVWSYPYHWNVAGRDESAFGVSTYAVGLAIMVAAIGSALVTDYIERQNATRAAEASGGDGGSDASGGSGSSDSVSTADVERDIEDAMSNTELSWGGVQKDNTKRLKIRTDEGESGIERSNFDRVGANERRESGSVDDAVNSLNSFRGGQREEARSEGSSTDDQAARLKELRERQQAEAEKVEAEAGFLDKLKNRFP